MLTDAAKNVLVVLALLLTLVVLLASCVIAAVLVCRFGDYGTPLAAAGLLAVGGLAAAVVPHR